MRPQDLKDIPREVIDHVVSDIDLFDEAIRDDIFFTRDPNVTAMLLCLQQRMVKVKQLRRGRFGNRAPQKIVVFGFAGHDRVFRFATNAMLNVRSSIETQNINVGELKIFTNIIKTMIHGFY